MKKRPATQQEDRVNLRILECLAQHGRMPYAQIAETLKLSANAVRDRILSMERRGVIRSYHAVLNGESVGRPLHVLAMMHPGPRKPEAVKRIRNHGSVVSVTESNGKYGLVIELRASNLDDVHAILRENLYADGFELAEVTTLGTPLKAVRDIGAKVEVRA